MEIKSFSDTYKLTSLTMRIGIIYPNPATDKRRLLAIPLEIISVSLFMIFILLDIWNLLQNGQVLVVIRHIGVCVPFVFGFVKMSWIYYKRVNVRKMMDIIDRDFAQYRNMPEKYKLTALEFVHNTHSFVKTWVSCVIVCFLSFVGTASVSNAFDYFFVTEPKRYMIYDINMPESLVEDRFSSPFFEIMFAYTMYAAVIYAINTTGYDCFMVTVINHACLRMAIFGKRMEDAMTLRSGVQAGLTDAIEDQMDALRMIELIQSTFSVYLSYIYAVVWTEMVICLYLINEGFGFDFQFFTVFAGAILHLYVPCFMADKLKCAFSQSAVQVYCSGWESVYSLRVRRSVPFVIARSQRPVVIKACGLAPYNMDLFVRTMKSAYAMYTLLKTQQ